MKNLTLIIPTKKEVESLPVFLNEIENFKCEKLIVLQEEDIETKNAISSFNNIKISLRRINITVFIRISEGQLENKKNLDK